MGTRPGILRGLTVTGGVITSTGIVLATFLVLGRAAAGLPAGDRLRGRHRGAVGHLRHPFDVGSGTGVTSARIWWPSNWQNDPSEASPEGPNLSV